MYKVILQLVVECTRNQSQRYSGKDSCGFMDRFGAET